MEYAPSTPVPREHATPDKMVAQAPSHIMSPQLLVGFPQRHAVRTGGILGMERMHTFAVGSQVLFPFPLLTPTDFHYKNEDIPMR